MYSDLYTFLELCLHSCVLHGIATAFVSAMGRVYIAVYCPCHVYEGVQLLTSYIGHDIAWFYSISDEFNAFNLTLNIH
jgi:hypothetical protein